MFIEGLESEGSRRTSLPSDFESPTMEPDVTGCEDDMSSFRKVHLIYDDSDARRGKSLPPLEIIENKLYLGK
jgi:hypothetical protein